MASQGRAQLEALALMPWASRRRQDLLRLLDQVDAEIIELTASIEQEAEKRPEVVRLMTHPGVGALTEENQGCAVGSLRVLRLRTRPC